MKRRTKAQLDPDCVVILSASDEKAFRFRRNETGVVMEGAWDSSQIVDANVKSPAATIAVLQPARIVCRTIELPDAPEDKLEIALQLQAETKQMGSVHPWRTASSVLAFRCDDGGRTGVVVDWPTNDVGPSLSRDLPPDGEPLFAGDSAILAAVLDGCAAGPLVSVTQDRTAFSFALRTPKGLAVRSTRIDPSQWPDAATVAVVESALRGGMNAEQAEVLVGLLDEAIEAAGDGGFGCTQIDRDALSTRVSGIENADEWREHGLKALAALMWFSHAKPLVSLRAQPLGERPGHVGEWINHLGEPQYLVRAAMIFLVTLILAPPICAGARLLWLHWKIGDMETKERSLRAYEKQLDLYSDLSRHAWPMGKLLGDLSNVTPEGIEWEDLTISQDRNVSIRGLAKSHDELSGTEVILALEKQLSESKVFDKVTKRWDPPDSKGMLKFTLSATVVRPSLRPNFKEAQDFGRKTLAERKYPAPPPSPAHGDTTSVKNDGIAASTASVGAAEDSSSAPKDIPSLDPLNDPAQNVTDATASGSPASTVKTTKRATIQKSPKSNSAPTPTETASAQPAANPSPTENTEDDSDTATQKKSRGSRTTTSGTNDLPKRSERTPDSANVSTPIPPPLSETELNAMTKDELQTAMGKVAIARQSAEVDDDTKKRLKEEFDRLKNYLKGKK
jgi:hypothetical protein